MEAWQTIPLSAAPKAVSDFTLDEQRFGRVTDAELVVALRAAGFGVSDPTVGRVRAAISDAMRVSDTVLFNGMTAFTNAVIGEHVRFVRMVSVKVDDISTSLDRWVDREDAALVDWADRTHIEQAKKLAARPPMLLVALVARHIADEIAEASLEHFGSITQGHGHDLGRAAVSIADRAWENAAKVWAESRP